MRRVRRNDLDALLSLCAEHAAFERAPYDPHGHRSGLGAALFGASPRLQAWVATCGKRVNGYATATVDFSTWRAAPYLHMDCLFVRAEYRGRGMGALLLHAVLDHARAHRLGEVQWQTPSWNVDAQRFYGRHRAGSSSKTRYTLTL